MMRNEQTPRLSGRLRAIVDMVSPGSVVCDVGCDHAHVPIALLKEGRIPSALAMDVIPGPLVKAGENLALYGEEKRVVLRLSDGLDAYRAGEAQCLIVTGMGGRIIRDILTREPEKSRDFTEMVLSPQADQWLVRQALRDLGYCIDREALILEDGKYYPVIHAAKGAPSAGLSQVAACHQRKDPFFHRRGRRRRPPQGKARGDFSYRIYDPDRPSGL